MTHTLSAAIDAALAADSIDRSALQKLVGRLNFTSAVAHVRTASSRTRPLYGLLYRPRRSGPAARWHVPM